MDGSPLRSIIIFIICLFGCMICASSETAFSSVSRVRMMSRADAGDKRAKRVLSILDNFDDALSATLICNNVCSIGCATASTVIAVKIGGNAAVTIATVITTLIVFFTAEMLPKKFAKDCAEFFAPLISGPISVLIKVIKPFIIFFNMITHGISRIFFGKDEKNLTYTENELEDIIDNITDEENQPQAQSGLIRSAFTFSDIRLKDIQTSWGVTYKLPYDADYNMIMKIVKVSPHTRFPVVRGETPVGVLHIRHYLKYCIDNNVRANAADVMTEPLFIDCEITADDAISLLSRHKTNLAFITESDGDTKKITGIVTVEDILECLVGDINDESDKEASL